MIKGNKISVKKNKNNKTKIILVVLNSIKNYTNNKENLVKNS